MIGRSKNIVSGVYKSHAVREMLREIGKIYLLLIGVGLLALSAYVATTNLSDISDAGIYSQPSGFGWELSKIDIYEEPKVEKQMWEISESEMNRNRVIYNWSTKPGLKLFSWQILSLMIGTALIVHKARLWSVVSIRRAGSKNRNKKTDMYPNRGVVRIKAMRGVIYISGFPDIAAGMEEFGLWLRPAWVVVE